MGRILSDFEDRRWITRDGRTYKLTRLGELVAERFMDLREAMETTVQWCVLIADFRHRVSSYPSRAPETLYENVEAGADVYRYEGDIPCNLLVINDTVFIKSSRPESVKLSCAEPIVSESETVRSWACDLIGTYRNEANHIGAKTFAGGQ